MKKWILATLLVLMMLFSSVPSFAAADTAVTIESPADTVFGDNLLVSIKLTAPRTIKVSVFEEKEKSGDTLISIDPEKTDISKLTSKDISSVSIMTAEKFTSTGLLQFYSKKIEKVTPGLYRVKVETLNAADEVIASSSTRFVVMEQSNDAASASVIFETKQSAGQLWLQKLIKSIFGN
ncbi:MAG: hypothetical protein PHQ50_03160 [Eubacteriales bacterium]|nr:hypothetical protein [Eubacteriales bacterium]MDD3350751.1 hypothetical protein [Eubacteriales bacterium]